MTEVVEVECPFCGEVFVVQPTISEGCYETIEDCMVCCRPVLIVIEMSAGECLGVYVERS